MAAEHNMRVFSMRSKCCCLLHRLLHHGSWEAFLQSGGPLRDFLKAGLSVDHSPLRGRGNGASVLRIVPYAALHFGAYEYYRELLVNAAAASLGERLENFTVPPALDLVAGSAAGATAVLVRASLASRRAISAHHSSVQSLHFM